MNGVMDMMKIVRIEMSLMRVVMDMGIGQPGHE